MNHRRHILLVSYHFPPDPAVGSLRAERVARTVTQRGHRVTVLTATLPPERERDRPVHPRLDVRPVQPLLALRDLYMTLRWGRRTKTPGEPAGAKHDASEASWQPPEHVATWKRVLSSLMWLPDDRHGFILPAVAAGMQAFSDGADLLYTTGPPFSGHVVGLLLERLTGMPWICEYRDPWVANSGKPTFVRSVLSDAIENWLEQRTRKRAARLVAVSQGIHTLLVANPDHVRGAPVILVRNGIARTALPSSAGVPRTQFLVVHAGTFYYGRNPWPFLRAVRQLLDQDPGAASVMRIELIGDCRWYRGQSVEAEVRRLSLQQVVHFVDWLPHEQSWERLAQADLLLLLAQHQPLQVPNKLYEYLGARRPILALVDAVGETATLLRQVGGHTIVTREDPDRIARALASRLDAWRAAEAPPSQSDAALAALSTDAQMSRLCSVIEGL